MTRRDRTDTKLRLASVIALIVGAVLVRSAMFHIENPYAHLSSIYGYRLTTSRIGAAQAATLPFLQLTLGLTLLFVPGSRAAAFGWSGAMFSAFVLVQSLTYLRGIDVSCGCFSGGSDSRIGVASIGLAASCAIAALCGRWFLIRGAAVADVHARDEVTKADSGAEPEPTLSLN